MILTALRVTGLGEYGLKSLGRCVQEDVIAKSTMDFL